jgi:hypothetical protein
MPLDPDAATLVLAALDDDHTAFDKAAIRIGFSHIAKAARGPTEANLIAVIETVKATTAAKTEHLELLTQIEEAALAKIEGRIAPADMRHVSIIKTAVAAADRGEAVHAGVYRQSDILAAQRYHAGAIRKDDETPQRANARAWSTPEGQALRKALATATPDSPIEVMKSTVGEATAEVHRRALALQAASGHSIQKARTIVRGQDAELARRESAEGRAA